MVKKTSFLPMLGDSSSILRLGRSFLPTEGSGNPLQYSYLENPWIEEAGRLQSIGVANKLGTI